MSNRNAKVANLFLMSRDEKRKQIAGNNSQMIRMIGLFKSVPARKRVRREAK